MRFVVAAVTFVLAVSAVAAQSGGESGVTPMPPPMLLNKISMAIRGVQPAHEEFTQLDAAVKAGQEKPFIAAKIDEYMKSRNYVEKMNYRLEELFRLSDDLDLTRYSYYRDNALNDLFIRIARDDLPWDTLLTGKTYYAYPQSQATPNGMISDFSFYSQVANLRATDFMNQILAASGQNVNLPQANAVRPVQLTFAPDDPRIAGALTTWRFMSRYTTSAANKNRGRAAAIFRIFLCDSMHAQVQPVTAESRVKILEMMYPKTDATSSELQNIPAISTDSIHGSRPDCAACHYKLDPMGATYELSPVILSKYPSPGALTYRNTDGTLVDVKVNGIGGLGQAIVAQDEYARCQVQHFWHWFIGDDIYLSPKAQTELVNAFNRVGRKTNDFIKVMLNRPEFSEERPVSPTIELAIKVHRYLERCQSCHQGVGTIYDKNYIGRMTDLTAWPHIGQDIHFGDNQYWLHRMSQMLDLDHLGKYRIMPPDPKYGGFVPTVQDLKMIREWMQMGAPDESGHRMIK